MKHEKLRIHHGIGSRVLLDSDKEEIRYTYEEIDAGYRFAIYISPSSVLDEIMRLRDEMNLFIFREENGAQVEKLWFYTGNGDIHFDHNQMCLTIMSPTRIVYQPGSYEM